jgi:hypothetical protein
VWEGRSRSRSRSGVRETQPAGWMEDGGRRKGDGGCPSASGSRLTPPYAHKQKQRWLAHLCLLAAACGCRRSDAKDAELRLGLAKGSARVQGYGYGPLENLLLPGKHQTWGSQARPHA